MRFIKESKWHITMMTGAPNIQTIQKDLDAPSEDVAIHRAQAMYPNQQFVRVEATLLDPQTAAPSGAPSAAQQTTMGRMRGLTPLQGLKAPQPPGQPQQPQQPRTENRITYPYSIALPSRFGQLLQETSPVRVWTGHGQHGIIIEDAAHMHEFLRRLGRHRDRQGAGIIFDGIRSSLND